MLTSELLDAHRDTLKEMENTIAGLRREVEELASEGKEATGKISRLQADLDHVAEVQRDRRWSWSVCEESQGRGIPC